MSSSPPSAYHDSYLAPSPEPQIRKDAAERFARAAHALKGAADLTKRRKVVSELYDTCFRSLDMVTSEFTASIIMLHLQSMLGSWIDEDWWNEPADFLPSFYSHVSTDPNLRTRLIEASIEIASSMNGTAHEKLLEALETASMAAYPAAPADGAPSILLRTYD